MILSLNRRNLPWLLIQGAGLLWSGSLAGLLALAVGWSLRLRRSHWLLLLLPLLWLEPLYSHLQGRLYLWDLGLKVIRAGFPWGVGPGQFHGAFLEAQSGLSSALWSNAYEAHSLPLQLLAEHGLLALPLLLPLLWGLWRSRGRSRELLWGLSAFSLFAPLLSVPSSLFMIAYALGLSRSTHPGGKPRPLAWILGLLSLLLGSAQLLGDRLMVMGMEAQEPSLLRDAARLSLRPDRALRYEALLRLEREPKEAEALARRALLLTPSVEGWLLLGRIYMSGDQLEQAVVAFEEALRLNPRSFAGQFNLSLAWEAQGDRHRASQAAARARRLRPEDKRLIHLPPDP